MNDQQITELLLAISREAPVGDMRAYPPLAGFASEDEILAAFVDGSLTPDQSRCVQAALAGNPRLRQQWIACREAIDVINASAAATRQQQARRRRFAGGLGLAASVVVALLVTLQVPPAPEMSAPQLEERAIVNVGSAGQRPEPQAKRMKPPPEAIEQRYAREARDETLEPAPRELSADTAETVPVAAWEMYVSVYLGWTESPGGIYMPFAMAAAAHSRLAERCISEDMNDSQWLPENRDVAAEAASTFADIHARYPQALESFVPVSKADWCELGPKLRRFAYRAVIDQHDLESKAEDEQQIQP
ncbi:hypothetical protein [Pseudomaricurvus sp. HS19]|uniref:hypothetical protein n=1 Tax=Pseudomaricurvus sp. HS19 TaxID=2692626 RepID=UPI001372247A|nr:hypothetical protein [Pseudomaricurvus sp. HS19]MYM64346.1 hypothetical protein [Pseudomaricurvus sp. HS19]